MSSSLRKVTPNGSKKVAVGDDRIAAMVGCGALKELCIVCGDVGFMRCTQCNVAAYCSAHCMKTDWSHRHAKVCEKYVKAQREKQNNQALAVKPKPVAQQPN